MMLVMGAGFQFSSLTSGVVGQSVTAGDQQQWHYSSIVTGAQSTTQNNAHRYTQQTQEQFIAWSTHKAAQAQHTKEKERQAHYASSNVTQRTGTHKTTQQSNTRTAPSTQEHKAQHIKEQESTACLIYCHTRASGISSTHAPDQLTTPLVCNKVISDYLCSFARLIAFPLCPENQKRW